MSFEISVNGISVLADDESVLGLHQYIRGTSEEGRVYVTRRDDNAEIILSPWTAFFWLPEHCTLARCIEVKYGRKSLPLSLARALPEGQVCEF